ncbi:MAG: glycosyltransferase family 9 protein [Candidatus Dormibacteria bacterium]|jgi:ADP-heptose:LPS heptosyltransferase
MRVLVLVWGRQVETLQASPLLRTLAAGSPAAEITLACAPAAAQVARALAGPGEVITLRGLDPSASPIRGLAAWALLRRMRFDVAVICGTGARPRILVYLAGFALRLGAGGGLTTALLSDHVTPRRGENQAATWLRIAHLLGITAERHEPLLDPGPAASQEALVQLHSTAVADGRLLVALAPGTGHADLRAAVSQTAGWGPERWAHLANQLATRHGAGIVFVGAAEDEEAATTAATDIAAPHADLTGQLDVLGTAALFQLCDLVICGDSPFLHLAAAVGTPTIGLFGPTDGHRRGPYGTEHRLVQALPQRRGHHLVRGPSGMMEQIRVEDVLAAIETSL